MFYNYGGTSTIPFAISFFVYEKFTGAQPYYKYFGKKFDRPGFPNRWDTYPVKPIYYAKIFAVISCVTLSILFISLFSWYLLPIPFFLFKMIDYSSHINFYQATLMGNRDIAFASSITCLFFITALIYIYDKNKYLKYMYICFICASISFAVKLTGAATFIFPISLLIYVYINNNFNFISKEKILLKSLLCAIVPYIILTPAVILDLGRYISWLQTMLIKQSVSPMEWLNPDRINHALSFIKDLYFLKSISGILIIILFIASSIVFLRIHPIFFVTMCFFHLFTFKTIITNTGDFPYSRLYMVLLFTPIMYLFFSLIYAYRKMPKYIKLSVLSISFILTISAYNIKYIYSGINKLIINKIIINKL